MMVSAPAALQSAHSSITPASRGHLSSALGLDCYLHAPDALCRARGCRAASHLTTLCHSQQPNLWLLMRPGPCTQSLHQLHPPSHLPLDLKPPPFPRPHGLSFPGTPDPRTGAPWALWDKRCGPRVPSPRPGCLRPPVPRHVSGPAAAGCPRGPGGHGAGWGNDSTEPAPRGCPHRPPATQPVRRRCRSPPAEQPQPRLHPRLGRPRPPAPSGRGFVSATAGASPARARLASPPAPAAPTWRGATPGLRSARSPRRAGPERGCPAPPSLSVPLRPRQRGKEGGKEGGSDGRREGGREGGPAPPRGRAGFPPGSRILSARPL